MIRVAQVVTRFIAGAGGVALRGALALDPDLYEVTILSGEGGPLLARAEAAGMHVVRLQHMRPEISPRHDWLGLAELEEQLSLGSFDVVHTHSSKAGTLGRIAARRTGAAAVHTFHGFPFHPFQHWPRRAAYVAIERRLARITDRFLAIGSEVAAEAVRLGIAPPDRVLSVASAIDSAIPPAGPASRRAARELLGIAPETPLVGTVGRIDVQKAPEDMLAAFAALPGAPSFVWIGDGPLRPRLERAVARRRLQDRFLILGERQDVARLLPGLDVFAMASLYEGLPCALVEAMRCGIPAVATAVNSVPDVIQPGRTGLLAPPHAPVALARAIEHLLAHRDHAQTMAAAARGIVEHQFDAELLGRDLMETYEGALADRADRAGSRQVQVSAA